MTGCFSRFQKRSTDVEASVPDLSKCYTGSGGITIGVGGSAGQCTRGYGMAYLYFEIPDMQPEDLYAVEIDFSVVGVAGGGVNAVLHGLGMRTGTISDILASQLPSDYFVGVNDGLVSTKLLAAPLLAADRYPGPDFPSVLAPATETLQSSFLTDYVKDILVQGGAGNYLVMRVTGMSTLGCEASCAYECQLKRYQVGATPTMKFLSLPDASPPSPPPPPTPPTAIVDGAVCLRPCGQSATCGTFMNALTCSNLATFFGCDCVGCCTV